MPTVSQELMPPMDTGAIAIKITTDANLPIEKTQELFNKLKINSSIINSNPISIKFV